MSASRQVRACEVETVLEDVLNGLPQIEALVIMIGGENSAGSLEDPARFTASFERAYFRPLAALKAAVPRMASRGKGKIVVILPRTALISEPRSAPGSCAGWALRRVCQSLRAEVGSLGIDVQLMFASEVSGDGASSSGNGRLDTGRVSAALTPILQNNKDSSGQLSFRDRLIHSREHFLRYHARSQPATSGTGRGRWMPEGTRIRSAVITGASSGLGRELARLYGPVLNRLHLVGRNEAALEELREEITRTSPCQVQIARVDLASAGTIAEFASSVEHADLLINCAGFSVVGEVKDVPLEMFRRNMAVNFLGPVILTSEFLKKPVKPQTVVNVLSTTAVAGRRMHGCYSSTKAALWAFTRILRRVASPETRVVEVLAATFASRFANNTIRVGVQRHRRGAASNAAGCRHGLTSRAVAARIYKAVQNGREYVFVPFAARLFLALETTAPSAFGRLFK